MKQFIKVNTASNEDGKALFGAVCENVLHVTTDEAKEMLGIPAAVPVNMKDVITLIQENKLECEISIMYEDTVKPNEETKGNKESDLSFLDELN